jgi:hypothetical protein
MQSWQCTVHEHFVGSKQFATRYYRVDRFFVTFKRWDVWHEMRFSHVLN